MDFKSFLITIATLFILLIIGYVAGKRGIIDSVASKKLSSLIINIGQPALIIYSITSQPYTKENLLLGLKHSCSALECICLWALSLTSYA